MRVQIDNCSTALPADQSFDFGQNWQNYLDHHVDEAALHAAQSALRQAFGDVDFSGKRFLDIGCGSGIHSLAAVRLGARVVSIDIDGGSIKCCRTVKQHYAQGHDWSIHEVSVLNPEELLQLGTFDLIYSFGVLHHTGNVDRAIDNTLNLVRPQGLVYLGLYNKIDTWWRGHHDGRFGPSTFWSGIKRMHATVPDALKPLLCALFVPVFGLASLLQGNNPLKAAGNLKATRGMNWWIDVRDWIGGWPYQPRPAAAIQNQLTTAGFDKVEEVLSSDLRNNLFLYKKR